MKNYQNYIQSRRFIEATIIPAEPSSACCFQKLFAFCADYAEYRTSLNYIGACACMALEDMAIMRCRTAGYNTTTAAFFQSHKDHILIEKEKVIQNRLLSTCLKAMNHVVYLNSIMRRTTGETFLNVRFERTDEGLFKLSDAMMVVKDFAISVEQAFGKSIYNTFMYQ